MRRLCVLAVYAVLCVCCVCARRTDKPLLTFACMSDIHSQQGMIATGRVEDVRLRTSFLNSLRHVRESERIDALVLCGDYTSDVTIPEANWRRVRELMATAAVTAFPEGARRTPVLYAVGNHDYEVANFDKLPKPYVAGDFYPFPMERQTGRLRDGDCFYEYASNGAGDSVRLLAAYHYRIGGVDFVVQNCGKFFFANAWDYQDSRESCEWVERKLQEIDPKGRKTIIYINHLPLPGTVGATEGKTLKDNEATRILTRALARHPRLLYLYGHDHSSRRNMSYITDRLTQRISFYDANGCVVPDGDGAKARGFCSCFVGSMRYNSLDSNASPGVADSPIIQTLIVKVYKDRVVLKMHNFGRTGKLVGAAVSPTLTVDIPAVTIFR